MAVGDIGRAREQSAKSAAYLRDEFGLEPSATLAHALYEPLGREDKDPRRTEAQGERTVEALLDAGRAAVPTGTCCMNDRRDVSQRVGTGPPVDAGDAARWASA